MSKKEIPITASRFLEQWTGLDGLKMNGRGAQLGNAFARTSRALGGLVRLNTIFSIASVLKKLLELLGRLV